MKILLAVLLFLLVSAETRADYRPQSVQGAETTVLNGLPCWNSTTGDLVKDCTSITTPVTFGSTPSSLVIDTTQQINPVVSWQSTLSGTVTTLVSDTASMPLWFFKTDSTLIGPGLNTTVGLLEADWVDHTTTNNDSAYFGVTGNCNIVTTKAGNSKGTSCIGVTAAARGLAGQGGTVGAEQGGIHGINIVSGLSDLGTTPTNYHNVVGAEADIIGCNGCTLKFRVGFYAVDWGDGFGNVTATEKGSSVDAAIAIASLSGPNYGWMYGIDFSGLPISTGNALATGGTVLGSSNTVQTVAAFGVDLNNFIMQPDTNPAFRGPGGTWVVTGNGDELANSVTSKSLVVNNTAAQNSYVNFYADGAVKWSMGREAAGNDFVIHNRDTNFVILRADTATDVISIGNTNPIAVSASGGVTVAGVSTSTGSIAGAVCMSSGKVLIYKVGANCF